MPGFRYWLLFVVFPPLLSAMWMCFLALYARLHTKASIRREADRERTLLAFAQRSTAETVLHLNKMIREQWEDGTIVAVIHPRRLRARALRQMALEELVDEFRARRLDELNEITRGLRLPEAEFEET